MTKAVIVAALVLGICGFVFGLLGLCAGAWSVISILAAAKSTHRIEYVQPLATSIESDLPPDIASQLPSTPTESVDHYLRRTGQGVGQSGYLADDPNLDDFE